MIKISHRGNLEGPEVEKENHPDYIDFALNSGFEVEIDVWFNEGYYLGHDEPKYLVPLEFLIIRASKLWCHAKNLPALVGMIGLNSINCFWHQEDDVVLTSKNFLWTYPGKDIADARAIAVMPEQAIGWDFSKAYGVCSDYVKVL